jgi:N-acetylglucosaminyldiphosphoundecaprenol N-acetyl-beta-D-mannosaminyltransferase
VKNELLGVGLDADSKDDLYKKVLSLARAKKASLVVRPNAEIITYAQTNPEFKQILNSANCSIPDGIGVLLASKILGVKIAGRFGGPESMFEIIKLVESNNLSVYLLGSSEEVVRLAARNIKKALPKIGLVGFHSGYLEANDEIIDEINKKRPDIIFVGMGSPLQETWVNEYLRKFDSGVFVMEGGSFDYLSGKVRRAPKFIQKLGLEWLYRLIREPKRLRRQLRLPKFIWLVVREKLFKK